MQRHADHEDVRGLASPNARRDLDRIGPVPMRARVTAASSGSSSSNDGIGMSGCVISAPGGVDELEPTTTVRSGADGWSPRSDAATSVEHEEHVGLPGAEPVRLGVVVSHEVEIAHDRAGLLREPDLVESADVVAGEHRRGADHLGGRDHAGAADPDHADRDVVVLAERNRRRRSRSSSASSAGRRAAWCGPAGAPPVRGRVSPPRGRFDSTVMNDGQSPSRHE